MNPQALINFTTLWAQQCAIKDPIREAHLSKGMPGVGSGDGVTHERLGTTDPLHEGRGSFEQDMMGK